MSYPRLSRITRSEYKTALGANDIFSRLSDTQKNILIDKAALNIASLRNSLSKEDYQADTIGTGTAMMPVSTLRVTTVERTALGLTLGTDDFAIVFDTDLNTPYFWSGTAWV